MQEGQKEPRNGRSEISPRTVHTMEAEEVAEVADSAEAGMLEQESSAAD